MPRRRQYRIRMTLLVAGLLLAYLAGNGRVPLFDRDEPRYAVASRQMLESGDWVVPRFLDEVRTAKPPAIYWLQALSMRLFGTDEFAVRLPGALACAGTVALLAMALPPLVGRRRAAWACFFLGTSVLVLGVAKVGVIDGVLLPCAAVMQIALLRIVRGRGRSWANAVALWVAVGVGGLLKGPVILGVLVTTLLAWHVLGWINRKPVAALPREAGVRETEDVQSPESAPTASRGDAATGNLRIDASVHLDIRRLHPLLGLLVIALICGPWLVLVELCSPGFLGTALWHDVGARSVRGLEGHGRPPGFHLLALFATWFPWSVLLPAAIILAWRRRANPTIRFALAGCIGPWLMFELIATKLPHYVLPIFPMLALLTADWTVRALRRRMRAFSPRTAAVIFVLVAAGFAAAPWLLGVRSWPAVVLAVAWAAALGWTWRRRRIQAGLLTAGMGMGLVVAFAYAGWLGGTPMLTVSQRVAAALEEAGAREVLMVDYKEPSLAWYAGECGIGVAEAGEEALETAEGFAVTSRLVLARADPQVCERWEIVAVVPALLYNENLRQADVLILRRAATVPRGD